MIVKTSWTLVTSSRYCTAPSPGLHVLAGDPGVPELVPVHEAALLPGQQPPPPQQHHPCPAHQPRLRHRRPDGAGPLRALGVPVTCHVSRVTVVSRVVLQTKAIQKFVITEKAPTMAFSSLKAATTPFTFKTLLRHYAKRTLTPRSLNMKLGPRRNYHKGRAAIRHYANQPACPF